MPPPIDNSELVAEDTVPGTPADKIRLRPALFEGVHYALVPEAAWKLLVRWHGGGPAVSRRMIVVEPLGLPSRREVEVYPIEVQVWRANNATAAPALQLLVSRNQTVGQLHAEVCARLWTPPHASRLWHLQTQDGQEGAYRPLLNHSQTLDEYRITGSARLFLEVREPDGVWPGPPRVRAAARAPPAGRMTPHQALSAYATTPTYAFGFGSAWAPQERVEEKCREPAAQVGVCGLSNLGNTCFMNAALQSLSNAGPLREYFLSGRHLQERNRDNPLGMKGKLAKRFGELLEELWSGRVAWTSPSALRSTLVKFAPQFGGFRQQDAQELLAFLLDGLHEDLNRVRKKPYFERQELSGSPSQEQELRLAALAWEQHHMRNDSLVVDLFQGQLRSALRCPDPACARLSITFDPFMYLSLPLPRSAKRPLTVYLLRARASSRLRLLRVRVPRAGCVRDLKRAAAKTHAKLRAEKVEAEAEAEKEEALRAGDLEAVDVASGRVFAFLADYRPLHAISDQDTTLLFELPQSVLRRFRPEDQDPASLQKDKDTNKDKQNGKEKEKKDKKEKEKKKKKKKDEKANGSAKDAPAAAAGEKAQKAEEEERQKPQEHEEAAAAEGEEVEVIVVFRRKEWNMWAGRYTQKLTGMPLLLPVNPARHTAKDLLAQVSALLPSYLRSIFVNVLRLFCLVPRCRLMSVCRYGSECRSCSSCARAARTPPPPSLPSSTPPRSSALLFSFLLSASLNVTLWIAGRVPSGVLTHSLREPPVELRLTTRSGATCGLEDKCPVGPSCTGCKLPRDGPLRIADRATVAVDFPENIEPYWREPVAAKGSGEAEGKAERLEDCLALFAEAEKLGPEDAWYCPGCKRHQQATKQLQIWRTPRLLILRLKRFYETRYARQKLDTMVEFPLRGLDLTPFVPAHAPQRRDGAPLLYDLFAVVNHSGGLGGGHYTAFAQNHLDQKWYHFNDRSTRQVPESDVVSRSAYVLFYIRRDENSNSKANTNKLDKPAPSE
jgi:ubiquitin carboxyl-terminal hydrolase 4/11/15